MPLSTIHMCVADAVCRAAGWNVSGQILLGCIAPDGVQMRRGADEVDMNRTHLKVPDWKTAYRRAADLAREHMDNPFLVGCAIHIMTDVLWRMGPQSQAVEKYRRGQYDEPLEKMYARDCYTAERALFRTEPAERMWRAAIATPAQAYADLVNADEVDRWRRERFAALQVSHDPRASYLITLPGTQAFIEKAGQRIAHAITEVGE